MYNKVKQQFCIDYTITSLYENEIFVFGSNVYGQHGKGAAKTATYWGAKWGKGVGLSGQTYAIPTKSKVYITLPLKKIKEFVDEFIEFTKTRKDLTFLVTAIGCGLAGYSPKDIAPLFKDALGLDNILLPITFKKYLIKDGKE